ncbi:MAG: hypothetical protein K2J72_05170 [Oscillospiraceae bacterium]|nr:hypothetical protein [Oscillospiraceae bacterium]
MDCNEFSFDALFESNEFKVYESKELLSAYDELNRVLISNTDDAVTLSNIESAALGCISEAQRASFMQGFCFAVKSIKFLMKI